MKADLKAGYHHSNISNKDNMSTGSARVTTHLTYADPIVRRLKLITLIQIYPTL